MSRATSYGSKPGDNWQELLETLSSTTFFLLARSGPTVFSVRDEAGKICKVTISNPHSCTCGSFSSSNLCIHQVFVLLKVLKIPQDHPLSYQTSLTDSEISMVLSGSCGGASKAIKSTTAARRQNSSYSSKKQDNNSASINDDGFVHRQELDEDGYMQCPICQDDMSKEQALTWCRKGCGNNIHAKCMQNYSQYKISNKEAASCPLCRVEWVLDLLKGDCRGQASLKHSCSPVFCTSCTFPQGAKFNRCVECSQTAATFSPPRKPIDFCLRCYTSIGREHTNHHFVSSDASVTDFNEVFWVPVVNHRSLSHIMDKDTLAALQQRELSIQDYEALLELDKVVPDLPTQLILSLIEVTREEMKRKEGNKAVCWCSSKASTVESDRILKLPCQHTCHESCLQRVVREAVSISSHSISNITCGHIGCSCKIYPSLVRKRKRKAAAPESAAPISSSSPSAVSALSSATSAEDVGRIGLSTSAVSISTRCRAGGGVATGALTRHGVRGTLRIGPVLREIHALSRAEEETPLTVSLGISGLGISASGLPSADAAPINLDRIHSKKSMHRNKATESSILLGTGSNASSGTTIAHVSSPLRHGMSMSSSSTLTSSSSSSSAHFNTSITEQPVLQGDVSHLLPATSAAASALRRRMYPPRPRSTITATSNPDVLTEISGLDIQGVRSTGASGTSASNVLSLAQQELSHTVGSERLRSLSISSSAEEELRKTRRRLELTRSSGSSNRAESDLELNVSAVPSTCRAALGIMTSDIGIAGQVQGHVREQRQGRRQGGEVGLRAMRERRLSRVAVGIALRDAVVSDGTTPIGIDDLHSLSLLLKVNGQNKNNAIPLAKPHSGRIAGQAIPCVGGVRRGGPSIHRNPQVLGLTNDVNF